MARKNEEAQHQMAFFKWLDLAQPVIRKLTFAIPNGGSRNVLEAVNLKRQGVTKGVADVFVSLPNNNYHGLYIEFKAGKNKLTRYQEVFSNEVVDEIIKEVKY